MQSKQETFNVEKQREREREKEIFNFQENKNEGTILRNIILSAKRRPVRKMSVVALSQKKKKNKHELRIIRVACS